MCKIQGDKSDRDLDPCGNIGGTTCHQGLDTPFLPPGPPVSKPGHDDWESSDVEGEGLWPRFWRERPTTSPGPPNGPITQSADSTQKGYLKVDRRIHTIRQVIKPTLVRNRFSKRVGRAKSKLLFTTQEWESIPPTGLNNPTPSWVLHFVLLLPFPLQNENIRPLRCDERP